MCVHVCGCVCAIVNCWLRAYYFKMSPAPALIPSSSGRDNNNTTRSRGTNEILSGSWVWMSGRGRERGAGERESMSYWLNGNQREGESEKKGREEERKSRVVKWEDTEKQVNKQWGRFEEDESNGICMQREREWRLRVDLKVEFKRGLNLFLPSERVCVSRTTSALAEAGFRPRPILPQRLRQTHGLPLGLN